MPKFLVQASYAAEGAKGLLADGGSKRIQVVGDMVGQLGGAIEAAYFAFGGDDICIIVDMPDNASMTAIALTVAAAGIANVRTTVLITPEEVDAGSGIAVTYSPPGA